MKTIYHFSSSFLLAFVVLLGISNTLIAGHNSGGELTYTHLGGNTYHFHYSNYTLCPPSVQPPQVYLIVSSINCGVNQTYQMSLIGGTGNDIQLLCPGTLSGCGGGQVFGLARYEFEIDVTLTGICADWVFSVTTYSRNPAITTLMNPGSEDLYVEARLNNLLGDNSSPSFTNDPLVFPCVDADFHYNNGIFDADGDSIVYTLICPMSAAGVCVNFLPGYTAQQPISSNPPLTLDTFSGDLFMHPIANEIGVISYFIREYRNGAVIGMVRRDVLIVSNTCFDPPTATHINGTSQQVAYVFPNDTICFDLFTDDADPGDSLTLTWNTVNPSATFTTTTALHPTGTFCWSPDTSDVRSQPYMFTATVHDNACPLNNAGVYSYFIYVTLDSALVWAGMNTPLSYEFSVYPNPSSGIFELRTAEKISEIRVFDSFGKLMLKTEETGIDLSNYPSGIYIAELIHIDGSMFRQKLFKK